MTLNCFGVLLKLDNRKVFCTPGPRTKLFERIFIVQYIILKKNILKSIIIVVNANYLKHFFYLLK